MVDPTVASTVLGGTAGLGGAFSLVKVILSARAEAREKAADRELQNRISERGHLAELRKIEAEADKDIEPVTFEDEYEKTRPAFFLFGPIVTIKRHRKREKIPASRRTVSNARIIGMLAFAYAVVLLACGLEPTAVIDTLPPSDTGTYDWSILWGLFSSSRPATEVVRITAGGLVLPLAIPVVFVLSTYVTGLPFHKSGQR